MKLDLHKVLWRTRGLNWDYTFVLRPASPLLESWYDIYTKVFVDVVPDNSPVTRGGVLLCGDLNRPYVATAFRDKDHFDAAGRPVLHYLTCFPDITFDKSRSLNFPLGWAKQVVLALSAPYESTFNLSSSELQKREPDRIERVFSDACEKAKAIVLVGPVNPVYLDTTVEIATSLEGTNGNERFAGDSLLGRDESVSKRIEAAIIEGEAYALGFKGYLGSLSLLVSNLPDSDLRHRLADSFGGVSTDQFIKMRMNNIRGRVIKAALPTQPRRGIESITDAMTGLLSNSTERHKGNKRDIALLLGASVDDKVVESVVARLGPLRLLDKDSR